MNARAFIERIEAASQEARANVRRFSGNESKLAVMLDVDQFFLDSFADLDHSVAESVLEALRRSILRLELQLIPSSSGQGQGRATTRAFPSDERNGFNACAWFSEP